MKKYLWPFLIVVMVVALSIGTFTHSNVGPQTPQQRIDHLATQIRCPTCEGLSVEESQSPLAQSAKQEITSEVAAGRTDKEIKDYFISRYGPSALMSPPRKGFVWTVWVLPFIIGLALFVGVVFAIRKWGRGNNQSSPRPSDSDRRRVELALGKSGL